MSGLIRRTMMLNAMLRTMSLSMCGICVEHLNLNYYVCMYWDLVYIVFFCISLSGGATDPIMVEPKPLEQYVQPAFLRRPFYDAPASFFFLF